MLHEVKTSTDPVIAVHLICFRRRSLMLRRSEPALRKTFRFDDRRRMDGCQGQRKGWFPEQVGRYGPIQWKGDRGQRSEMGYRHEVRLGS